MLDMAFSDPFRPAAYDGYMLGDAGAPIQSPSISLDDMTSSVSSTYLYGIATDRGSFSSDGLPLSIPQSGRVSSRRSSTISPHISMSEDGKYTPMTEYDSPTTLLPPNTGYWPTEVGRAPKPMGLDMDQMIKIEDHQTYLQDPANQWNLDRYMISSTGSVFQHPGHQYESVAAANSTINFHETDAYGLPQVSSGGADPSLSRSIIFPDTYGGTTSALEPIISQHPLYTAFVPTCPMAADVQTIAPQTAFQPLYSSPAHSVFDPVTPVKASHGTYGVYSSSPPVSLLFTPNSACSYRTNNSDGHEWVGEGADRDWTGEAKQRPSRANSQRSILHRSRVGRGTKRVKSTAFRNDRRVVGLNLEPKPGWVGSGMDSDAIIPENEFECSFPSCFQPSGKRTSFKRQEHKKRHEKTVHGHEEPFRCRFCDKSFNRNDNLKQHYKTHARRSTAQRNQWVAVLDKSSIHYDPEFAGGITRDGYPLKGDLTIIRCPHKNCVDVFHTDEALRAHEIKKEHRQAGAGKLPLSDSKTKEADEE